MKTPALALLLVAAPGFVSAAPAPGPAPPTTVDQLVVTGGPGPKLLSSWPAQGAKVSGGVVALELKFDQPISPAADLPAPTASGAPPCLARPRLLDGGRTAVILCTTRPNQSYAIAIAARPGLVSAAGRAPEPAVLKFSTDDTIVDNIDDALEEAGLASTDDPVMGWRQAGEPATGSPTTPVSAAAPAPAEKGALDSPAARP